MTRKRTDIKRSVSVAEKERWLIESYRAISEPARDAINGVLLALDVPTPSAIRAEIERRQRARAARRAKEDRNRPGGVP